jgi:hypothetical protein
MTSRRTLPDATVFSVRSLAVSVTGTCPVEWKVSVARPGGPWSPHCRDRLETVTRLVGDDDEDEDDEVVDDVPAGSLSSRLPGISGSATQRNRERRRHETRRRGPRTSRSIRLRRSPQALR